MIKWRDWLGSLVSLFIFLFLALITAFFSEYLLNFSPKNDDFDGPVASLENVLIGKTEKSGNLQSHLSASSITFNANEEAILISPVLHLYEKNLEPLLAKSDSAIINSEGNIITLNSNVRIYSFDAKNNGGGFEISAIDTIFNLDKKTAHSTGPVHIKTKLYDLKGVGMRINQSKNSIKILDKASLIKR